LRLSRRLWIEIFTGKPNAVSEIATSITGYGDPIRVIFDHLGDGRLTANQGYKGKTCTSADFDKLNIFNH